MLRMHLSDRVSSLLVTMVMIVGVTVVALTGIYLSQLKMAAPKMVIIELEDEKVAGRGDHAAGFARDFAPPGAEEIEQLTEPSIQQTLEAVTDAVSSIAASLETIESMTGESSKGGGLGDSRPPGPLGEGDTIGRFERWELKFAARTVQSYATQLDAFDIELAAIGGGIKTADYAAGFTGTIKTRSATGDKEKRLSFSWRANTPLEQFERQLMTKARIPIDGRIIVKFLTPDLEKHLATIEKQNAVKLMKRDVKSREYLKTVFECRPTTSGRYEWVVLEQKFRNPPPAVAR